MDEFWQDLVSGEIQFRDKWQFELKSEFSLKRPHKASTYTQEFYIFIPNSLQVNDQVYPKEEFYRDQTNLIRYKTPKFSLRALMDKKQLGSPLNRLKAMLGSQSKVNAEAIEDELKLLGNIFRSSLRDQILKILTPSQFNNQEIVKFCSEIKAFRKYFLEMQESFETTLINSQISIAFHLIDEFISNSIDYFLTGLLQEARKRSLDEEIDNRICHLIIEEKKYREKIAPASEEKEAFFYRNGLLKKFVIDALMLNTSRSSVQQKYGHYIGAISAGVAMLIYILLFIWQGQVFVMNSEPFIILTVLAYILKDRLKESLKNISYQRALLWFSDYTIEIQSPNEKNIIGELRESFTFVDENAVNPEILKVRNKEFHSILSAVKRPEQVMYIKKIVKIFPDEEFLLKRRKALNMIFRYNIQDFLTKASDPMHNYTTLNPDTRELIHTSLPKIYHLNIILRNTFQDENMKTKVEIKKFRLIIDKEGIKHIDQIKTRFA
ncbi:putative membrane protein [Chlamydiales bacterium STE3]|nr:putative membrane protein [Chlamydiales bacterium STE3]